MVENLKPHGFNNSSVLYYLDPTRETPHGLVKISGPEQVQEMLHSHPGTKKFHLYVVNECSDSSSTEEEEEYANHEPISFVDEVSSETTNNIKRDRDSLDCNRTNVDHIEDGSLQPKNKIVIKGGLQNYSGLTLMLPFYKHGSRGSSPVSTTLQSSYIFCVFIKLKSVASAC